MRALAILIVTFALCTDTEAQKSKKISESQWAAGEILIDGNNRDWNLPLHYYDTSTKISYSIANDSSSIYLCIATGDETMQMKILRAGMVVGLDTLGKRKQHISISYPLVPASGNPGNSQKARPGTDELKQNFKYKQQFMELSGFIGRNGISPVQAVNGVMACLDWNENGELIYELAIPFRSFGSPGIVRPGVSKPFCLNVSINALELPNSGPGAYGGSGRPGGGGPPGGSGGPGGGGPPSWVTQGGGGKDFSLLIEEQGLRQKFQISFR